MARRCTSDRPGRASRNDFWKDEGITMKLFRFDDGRIGMQSGQESFDITDALGIDTKMWPPVQMVQVIRQLCESAPALLDHPKTRRIDFGAVRLLVPIEWPNKLLAMPVNYVA